MTPADSPGPEAGRKTSGRWREPVVLLVLALTLAVVLGANPFRGQTSGPFDLLLYSQAWREVVSPRPPVRHSERTDVLDAWLPRWLNYKRQLEQGRLPLWNKDAAGGTPGAQVLSHGGLSLPFLVFAAVRDDALGFYLSCLLKLLVAGVGGFLLLRLLFGRLAALWGGLVFALCGFNAAWFYWPQVATAMWIPWLLWAALGLLRTGRLRWLVAVGVTSALLATGGFPFTTACGYYALALLLAVWAVDGLVSAPGRRTATAIRVGLAVWAAGLGFAACSFAVLPMAETLGRVNLGYRTGGTLLLPGDIVGLFLPPRNPLVERTGFVGIPALAVALGAAALPFRRQPADAGATGTDAGARRLFTIFAALLTVLALLVSFGFLPGGLIRALPALGNNPWSRMLVLVGLGFALLSATGLDWLLRPARNRVDRALVTGLAVALLAGQVWGQARLFRRFNAVVSGAWFYPNTPAISHVRGNLGPLESALADDSYFFFAGAVSAYGIPEWPAHAFRSDADKQLIRRVIQAPFASATALRFKGEDVELWSPLLDVMGVRFLMVRRGTSLEEATLAQRRYSHFPAPPLPAHRLVQYVRVDSPIEVESISLLLATYEEPTAPADVRLTVRRTDNPRLGRVVVVPAGQVGDNQWVDFVLRPALGFRSGVYSMELELTDPDADKGLTAWATGRPKDTASFLEVDGQPTDSALEYRFFAANGERRETARWQRVRLPGKRHSLLAENVRHGLGACRVAGLDLPADSATWQGVSIADATPTRVSVRYASAEPGWVVLAMRSFPGWRARVNGTEVEVERYLDVLPAIPVSGPSEVVYWYDPQSLKRGSWFSAAAALCFAAGTVLLAVTRRGRKGPRRLPPGSGRVSS